MTPFAPVTVAPMSPGRLIGAYLSDAKWESLRLLRTPAFSIPILAMPILFYLFFGVLLAGGRAHGPAANWMFVGWTVYAVMGPGLFGFGILVAVERNMGLLTFKRALPMPTGSYLTSKLLMALLFAIVVMAMLVATALTVGHVTLSSGQVATVAAVMSLGVIPACAIGLFGGGAAAAFALLHGSGNGILTIARGTLPLAIFGPANYAYRLGLIGAPSRICQAFAPLVFGLLIDALGRGVLIVSASLSLSALAALMLLSANAAPTAMPEIASDTAA